MSTSWVRDAQTKIYTVATTRAKKKLTSKYSKIAFTEDYASDSSIAIFPTVLIKFLPSASIGNSFEVGINGFVCGVQIDVVVSKTEAQNNTDAFKIMSTVADEFQTLGFNTNSITDFVKTSNTDIIRLTSRMSRNIGFNDVL